jgi:adenosylhomocysteine nucleosidase
LFALEHEAKIFRRHCPQADIHIIGIGAARAARNTQRIIDNDRPPAIVLAGYSGALRPGLKIGDVVIANRVSSLEPSAATLAPTLILSRETGAILIGALLSAQELIGDPVQKKSLHDKFKADAVDLESHAVATVCEHCRIPWAVVRVISDDVNTRLSPQVSRVIRDGQVSTGQVLKTVMFHPFCGLEFIRLAGHAALARRALSQFLVRANSSAG